MINLSGIFYDNGCIKPLHPKCLSLIGGRISCIYHISVHLCKIVIHTGTGVDYDLTQMNGDMVYATDPSTYEGKTFRMEGLYTPIIVEDTGKIYHYCLIQDALACCAQGMEFVSGDGSHTDQSEYPPEDTDIIVEGIFETYREEDDENLYCRLANATMEVVQ